MAILGFAPFAASVILTIVQAPQGPNPPQGNNAPPVQTQPPGVQQLPAADQVPPAPKMSQEEIAARLAEQLTGLAGRVQSLRRLANAGSNVSEPDPKSIPAATIEGVRRALGEISAEVQRRARGIELKVAANTALRLAEPDSRKLTLSTGVKPAPEPPRAAPGTAAAAQQLQAPTSHLPEFDPAKAELVVYKINGIPVTRGEIEELTAPLLKWTPELGKDTLAQRAISSAIIPLAVRKAKQANEIAPILAKAKALRADIVAGRRTFEDAAKELSEDPSTKPFGGLLDGWRPGLLLPFELAALAKLKPGDVSEPFLTASAVEILQLIEVTENTARMSDSTLKLRRIMFTIGGGASELLSLVKQAQVEVIDQRYDEMLPPLVKRGGNTNR